VEAITLSDNWPIRRVALAIDVGTVLKQVVKISNVFARKRHAVYILRES